MEPEIRLSPLTREFEAEGKTWSLLNTVLQKLLSLFIGNYSQLPFLGGAGGKNL